MRQIVTKAIDAEDHPLKEILSGKKYTVDYFQREYRWEKEHIEQMLSDLIFEFNNNHQDSHTEVDVEKYKTYFMGTIVLSAKDNAYSIIDGQQRLTSLTLLLIYLYHSIDSSDAKDEIRNMIYSSSYGKKSFNLKVEEREDCLQGLYEKGQYDISLCRNSSTRNMVERYSDIQEIFPSNEFSGTKLNSFAYWVINKLILVQIVANTEESAYTIFETMNDRGLSLTPSDMLKGFILSNFNSEEKRSKVNTEWKKDMQEFNDYGKDIDTQFFQAWMRAKFAETIRETGAGAVNKDFENIGVRFHNWFKDNYEKGLLKDAINGNIELFIEQNYRFYFKWFMMIKKAEISLQSGMEHLYYILYNPIAPTLTYPLLMSSLIVGDDDDTCRQKIDLVAQYIDGFVTRRSVNYHKSGSSTIRYTMYNLVKNIRNKSLSDLKKILSENIQSVNKEHSLDKLTDLCLNGGNKKFIKYVLCRLTNFIDEGSGNGNKFDEYMNHTDPSVRPYEIEHIWSDHPEWHINELPDKDDFYKWRNNIGDMLLLPNGTNQSYNDKPTDEKIPHYIKENILAKSLCDKTYQSNPNFTNFIKQHNLSFKPYETGFNLQQIKERAVLYLQMAELIWKSDF